MHAGAQLGRYRLLRPLGTGGMGEVWEAELQGPEGFRKPVALKRLRHDRHDPSMSDALVREARFGALLHHPNVVGVHALEEHEGAWLVVMELVRGASASQLIRHEALTARAVLTLGEQACAGLAHIHGLHIDGRHAHLVHRDIKPGNLLVDRHGTVKVADLGIASPAGRGDAVGTAGYAPAEQLASAAIAASDLFALGVTLLVAVTRKRPFGRGARALEAVERVEEVLDPDLLRSADAVVDGLGDVLARCLRTNPAERWPSAEALRAALVQLSDEVHGGPDLVDALAEACPDLDVRATPTPASRSSSSRFGNLPRPRSPLVGRQDAVPKLVTAMRAGQRLITLQGPGGVGKTRLALELARTLAPTLHGGAWFFDLSEATTIDGCLAAAGASLGLDRLGEDGAERIGRALFHKGPVVVVLDNLEQCREGARELVRRWLEDAPQARFLCTSRRALDLSEERVLLVDVLSEDEGVALFLQARPGVPDEHLHHVRTLVHAVDSIPLAIELAAARAKLLPLPMLVERIGPRLLAGGRDRPERHRSLEASLQWSWDLLDPPARHALAQLSVLDGPFDLSAAEAVLQLDDPALWALDVLQELCNASLVRVDASKGRFSMLVVVRDFARGRLSDRQAAEARHGAWFAQVAARPERPDLDNLVSATRRAVSRRDGNIAASCALGAWTLLRRHGPLQAGLDLLEATLPHTPPERLGEVRSSTVAALATLGRSVEAIPRAEAWLAETSEPLAAARIGERLAIALRHQADASTRAAELFATAVEAYRQAGDRPAHARALAHHGLTLETGGQLDAALPLLEASLGLAPDQPTVRHRMAGLLGALGRREEAEAAYRVALEQHRASGDVMGLLGVLINRGNDLMMRGRPLEGEPMLQEALMLCRRMGYRMGEGTTLGNLAGIQQMAGRLPEAQATLEATLALPHLTQADLGRTRLNLARVRYLRGYPGEALERLDAALPIIEAIPRLTVFGLITRAEILQLLRRPEERAETLEGVRRIVESTGSRAMRTWYLLNAGRQSMDLEDLAGARAQLEQGLQLTMSDRDVALEAVARTFLGEVAQREGRRDVARRELEAAEEAQRAHGLAHELAHTLVSLALLERDEGQMPACRLRLAEVDATLASMGATEDAPLARRRAKLR